MSHSSVLDDVLDVLQHQDWSDCHGNESALEEMSGMIHSLLDNLPPNVHRDDSEYPFSIV